MIESSDSTEKRCTEYRKENGIMGAYQKELAVKYDHNNMEKCFKCGFFNRFFMFFFLF